VSGSTATYTIAKEGSSWFISAMEDAVFVSGDASLSTKLILIEGLPGSGKSTVATSISSKLTELGVGHYSYLETTAKKPIKLLDPLSATYRQDLLAQWERLVAQSDEHTIVLESAFWQGTVDPMIGNNYPRAEIIAITDSVNSIVEPLKPKLIYLCHADVDSHIRWIFNSRGEKWAGEIVERDLRLPYHRDRGHCDISGLVEFFEDCQKLTDELYDRVPFQKTKICNPHQGWERVHREISGVVDEAWGGANPRHSA
jgi:hypothetical protein